MKRVRVQGLRPILLWVPDVRAPGFPEECRRQSRLVAESPGDKEGQDFIDATYEWPEF
ncbi:antitoxin MazE family protein [Methylocapsa palsarum]|uniref:antitoxin MazE family protein n=1 Tax=Methylocapsa palsarum TaxID=1612308 RepID=UPI000B836DB7|nr:antitoxin MazE family protein [Methylocapsa palsarum]